MCRVQEVIICRPDLIDPELQVHSLFLFLFPFRMFQGFDFWPFKSTAGKAIEDHHPLFTNIPLPSKVGRGQILFPVGMRVCIAKKHEGKVMKEEDNFQQEAAQH